MRGLNETTRLRLLLALMGLLQAAFLVVRAAPYGAAAHGLLAWLLGATALATALVAAAPERAGHALSDLVLRASATRARALGVLLAIALVAGVAGVATQQVFSWDERSVLWAAEVFAAGGPRELFARYGENHWLGPQHPPLVAMLYGAVTSVAGSHLKLLRLVDLAFGCGTVLVVALVGERLFDRRAGFVAALLLLASPLFQRVATAATNDMPLTFLFCLAVLVALRLERTGADRVAVLLGLVIGTGLLVKYTMVLVLPVLLALAWCLGSLARARRHAPTVLAIAFAMLFVWLDHAWSLGILDAQRARLGHLAGMAQRRPGWALDALLTKTPSALGIYTVPWIALGAVAAFRRRSAADRFVLGWVALVFVPLLLTLPDNRYFLPAFPALLLPAASLLVAEPRATGRVLLLAALLCAISLVFYAHIDLARQAFLFR